jgi:cyclophilin family peptidyl-prolyl cis-trans isomerase
MKKFLVFPIITTIILSGCANSQMKQEQKNIQASQQISYQISAPVTGDKIGIIETELGTIKIKLFKDHAPEMVKNFEGLANSRKYDGIPFHRVEPGFVIQGGDFESGNGYGGYSYKGPGTKLPDEIAPGFTHLKGTVSMANSGPNTNGSQFFIVTAENGTPGLDGDYSIFGQVYEGMQVVKAIESAGRIINMDKVSVETYKIQ